MRWASQPLVAGGFRGRRLGLGSAPAWQAKPVRAAPPVAPTPVMVARPRTLHPRAGLPGSHERPASSGARDCVIHPRRRIRSVNGMPRTWARIRSLTQLRLHRARRHGHEQRRLRRAVRGHPLADGVRLGVVPGPHGSSARRLRQFVAPAVLLADRIGASLAFTPRAGSGGCRRAPCSVRGRGVEARRQCGAGRL